MGNRLLIFGGYGFVGGIVAKLSHPAFKTLLAGRTSQSGFEEFSFFQADITKAAEVERAFETFRPNHVLNAAALSDIDNAESSKDLAYQINVEGARHVAQASLANGCRCLHVSSDAVFDGKSTEYREEDLPAPVNYYGVTKYEGEKAVMAANPAAVVIRVSLVLGFPVNSGNSFLARLKATLKGGNEVACAVDEIRTPVDVLTLSESILELAQGTFTGIVHVGSTQSIDRYTLTRQAATRLGFDERLIKPKPLSASPPTGVPRHKNGILCVAKAQAVLKTRMLDANESLERALATDGYFKMRSAR